MEKKRIEWIDYTRAFASICVVFGHVEFYSMNDYYGFWAQLQRLFCMPLFFFLSGFFSRNLYSTHDSWIYIKNKAKLLLPFISCGLLYILLFCPHRSLYSLFYYPHEGAHYGFWFLPVLFEMNLLFAFSQILVRFMHINERAGKGIMAVSLTFWGGLMACAVFKYIPEELESLLTISRIRWNFPFFMIGYFVAQNRQVLKKILSTRIYTITTTTFIILFLLREKYMIDNLFISYTLILCAIQIICYLSQRIESCNMEKVKGFLSYCGKRTMAIYLFHFFLLPRHFPWLNFIICPDGGQKDDNIIIELAVCGFMSFIIVVLAMIIEAIVDDNTLLRKIILGKWK